MTSIMEMKKSNLVLPTSGYELDREEMRYVEGGFLNWLKKAGGARTVMTKYAGAAWGVIKAAVAVTAIAIIIAVAS